MTDVVLGTKGLSKSYGQGEKLVKAVDKVNIQIQRGEFGAIVGKSGSGKSTLLHLLGGLDYPTAGEVWVEGDNIADFNEEQLAVFRRRKIGFVFQAYNLIASLNVWENIVLPSSLDDKEPDRGYMENILQTLGLTEKRECLPHMLPSGQQQRVAIARALGAKPAIVLADEPTGNLDSKTGDEVMALLKLSARQYGQTLVVITHDEDIAQMADRVLMMEDAGWCFDGHFGSIGLKPHAISQKPEHLDCDCHFIDHHLAHGLGECGDRDFGYGAATGFGDEWQLSRDFGSSD